MSNLAKTRVVTGYVPLPDHPRSAETYGKLGYQLSDALGDHPLAVYYSTIPQLWMTKFLEKLAPREPPLSWSKGDNPRKNSLEFHCVQYEKFAWLQRAADEDGESDTFIWIDYGIFSQPGMNAEVIRGFLSRVRKDDFAFPGCWPPNDEPIDEYPSWRFLGSLMIVPRVNMKQLFECMQASTRLYVHIMGKVTFEVNMMARVEPLLRRTPFRWYEANHDGSQFGNYR